MKCHYEGTGCLEGRCMGTKEIDPCIGYERCSMFKLDTTTNADRIRAMSDEELAEVIACGVGCVRNAPHCREDDCTPCIKVWLRQPVKGGDNE